MEQIDDYYDIIMAQKPYRKKDKQINYMFLSSV